MATTDWRVRDLTATDTISGLTTWRVRDLLVGSVPSSTTWRVRDLTATGVTTARLLRNKPTDNYEPGEEVQITLTGGGTPVWAVTAVTNGTPPALQSIGNLCYFTAPPTVEGTRITITDGLSFIEAPVMAVTEVVGPSRLPAVMYANVP